MRLLGLCLLLTLSLMAEGKPFFSTEVTRVRETIQCVTMDVCGSFSGIKKGNFRHPLNTNWFYTCFGYVREPECQQCASPLLHFSEKCNMCLPEINDSAIEKCPEVIQTITSTRAPITCDINFCDDKKDGLFTDPSDITKFIQCSNSYTYCQQCQPGLIFDISCFACVDPNHTAPPTTTAIP